MYIRIANLLTACLVSMLLFCSCNAPKRLATVENENIDLGTVYKTESPATCVIRLTNNGRKDLRVTKVKTDCECTTVEKPKKAITSGETVELPVSVDISTAAPFEKETTIGIYTDLMDYPVVVHLKMLVRNIKQ